MSTRHIPSFLLNYYRKGVKGLQIINKLKESYYEQKERVRKLKELNAQLREINRLIQHYDTPKGQRDTEVFEGVKRANFYDLSGVKDVTGGE